MNKSFDLVFETDFIPLRVSNEAHKADFLAFLQVKV
jgi:hypothetical protein